MAANILYSPLSTIICQRFNPLPLLGVIAEQTACPGYVAASQGRPQASDYRVVAGEAAAFGLS